MPHPKRLTNSFLTLSGITMVLLIYAAYWVRSADISDLSPLLTVGGNLHPVLLHLPIGIFIYIGFTEAWNFIDREFFNRWKVQGGLLILAFGTFTAVLAAFAGFLLYLQGDYSGELIERHMYWGTAFAASTLVVLCTALIFSQNSQLYRIVLFLNIIALSVAAHQGGLITHGDPLEPLFAQEETDQDSIPVDLLLTYNVVDRIFQSKCYNCHSVGKKKKGGLLMDSYEALLAGGKKGNALVPGSLQESKISTYIHLPLDDEHHMPPEGKPQLTEIEIQFIDEWIQAGSSPETRLIDQGLSGELFDWAVAYMATSIPVAEAPDGVETDDEPEFDFDALIAGIEQYALNSVTRVGPGGDQLVFSAVNARTTLYDTAVYKLLEAGPYLIEIDVSNTSLSAAAVGELIKSAPQLKRLNLSGIQIDLGTLEPLIGLNSLESLILFNAPVTEDLLPVLGELKQLRGLYLAGSGFSEEQIQQLRQSLPECSVVGDDYLFKHQPKQAGDAKEEPSDPVK